MPYVYFEPDEVPDGMEAVEAVGPDEYQAVVEDRDKVVAERDSLAEQLSVTAEDLRMTKEKYANAVLTSAARIKMEQEGDVKRDAGPQTFAELFAKREGA